jgi:predicted DNA-binding transcriptional regulator AlpA
MILDSLNRSKTLREASKKLGISERTIYRKIKDLDIVRIDNKYIFNKKAD